MEESYEIHDNGGRPYLVSVQRSSSTVSVDFRPYDSEGGMDTSLPPHRVLKSQYSNIWIGGKNKHKGNTIVLELNDGSMIYIGSNIMKFSLLPGDSVVSYHSEVGNSDVPYPYIIGKTHTYILLNKCAVPNLLLNFSKDVYDQFYGNNEFKSIKRFSKHLKTKIIHTSM
jgi:hypothetical protein